MGRGGRGGLKKAINNVIASFRIKVKKCTKDMNIQFSEQEMCMANKYRKKCSICLLARVMQTKAVLSYHLMPLRMAFIEKKSKITNASVERKGTGKQSVRT